MGEFPTFMKNPANRIAATSEHTRGIEGYVFDGADGSQMAFWQADTDAVTAEHVHDFDEYVIVVEGTYVLIVNGEEVRVDAGQEYHIPRGTPVAGRITAGTRTIHAFGGHRARRVERWMAAPQPPLPATASRSFDSD
jgi:quercetin dioxygenase-like cupin family protein